ncbi:MAG: hypothetical protein IPG66_06185 [Hydrogenophilales bacterium]|nr:hypothetical protein [Hydrogenophilales bacterium]
MNDSTVIRIGVKVVVKREQNQLLGGPKYPGRTGIVVRENSLGRNMGGLWYVALEATRRAKPRIELFCSRELERVPEGTS